MRYLPHTNEDIKKMLKVVGAESLDELFSTIPKDCIRKNELNLPDSMTEWELTEHIDKLSNQMASDYKIFIGAGSYNHYVPETIKQLLLRSELYTAYTPYQPEVSQGTLQIIYEYQTLISRLMGMDIANASMYDGASGLAEAMLMAVRITKKKKVAISKLIHPHYRKVVESYLAPTEYEIIELDYLENGKTDFSNLDNLKDLACVAVQSPNFFGIIEDLKEIGEKVHSEKKRLFVTAFTEPLSYGLLKNPGSCGADIVCGEGQSLGIPQSFGGPGLGIFTAKKAYMRSMPGRIVGLTTDINGKKGFVLTLATREQHIRREKATSNICSNEALCATTTLMYLASLGQTGIRELASINYDKAHYFKNELEKIGFSSPFPSPTFNEFVVKIPDFNETYEKLLKKKIIAGLSLDKYYNNLKNHYLFCVTETTSKENIDKLIEEIKA
jgi:glycine dehydrogenase subunit 1